MVNSNHLKPIAWIFRIICAQYGPRVPSKTLGELLLWESRLALWHLDFHHGSHKVLTRSGQWITPLVLGVIDDHSRLVCHLQWYLDETAESLVHGLCQAFQKRGLPRALMTDNGAAMQADEFRQGLHTLSILHETTLPYSPYQNAKQESFWATLEGRLMAMLEGVTELTLQRLNEITQAWVEQEKCCTQHFSCYVSAKFMLRQPKKA
jgi:putative transposase